MPETTSNQIKLSLDGKELKGAARGNLSSIVVAESIEQLDMIEATFIVPQSGSTRDKILALGKHGVTIKAEMCAGDSAERTLEGTVVEIAYSGGAGSALQLLVRGLSDLTKVKSSQLAVVHEGDDAAVIKKIASAAGLGADIQGVDGTGEFFLQPNLTNAEVVNAIAKRNNYVVRVDDGKLVFSRINKLGGATKLKVKWSEVMEYGVEQSLDGVVTDVMVTGKDLKANKWLKGTAAASDVTGISGGATATKLAKKAFGKIERIIDHTDDADQSQLVAMAKGELQRRAERFVRGEFTTTFLAEARTGAQLSFENPICDAMKGPFIVREVTHLFDADEGYRTRLSVISDSLPA